MSPRVRQLIAFAGGGCLVLALLVTNSALWILSELLLGVLGAAVFVHYDEQKQERFSVRSNWTAFVLTGVAILVLIRQDIYLLQLYATTLIYSIVCVGLILQFGYAGVMNFAAAAFFGIGAYVAAELGAVGVIPLVILVIAAGCSACIALIVILPMLRTTGYYEVVITLVFGLGFTIFLNASSLFGGPQGLSVAGLTVGSIDLGNPLSLAGITILEHYGIYAAIALGGVSLCILLAAMIQDSYSGLSLDYVTTDPVAAECFGVSSRVWRIKMFVIGNGLMGVGGALYGMMVGYASPDDFGFVQSLMLVAVIILAGFRSPWGVPLAAAIVFIVPEKLQSFGEYRLLIFALIVIAVLRFRPEGLVKKRLRRIGKS